MKRIWFGVGLLVALLVLGIWSSSFMERTHLTHAESLNRAADLAAAGNWSTAMDLCSDAKKAWDQKQFLIAALCTHEPMDQIEGLFAQLEVSAAAQNSESFRSTCVYLARQLEALGKSHNLNLENIL